MSSPLLEDPANTDLGQMIDRRPGISRTFTGVSTLVNTLAIWSSLERRGVQHVSARPMVTLQPRDGVVHDHVQMPLGPRCQDQAVVSGFFLRGG